MSSKLEKVTVVIPLYNPEVSFLTENLKVLVENEGELVQRIILVDDGSEKPIKNFASKFEKISRKITIIEQENKGAGAARNAGADLAKTRIVIFTDWDCRPHKNWLENLIKPIVSGEAAAVGGKILTYKERNIFSEFSNFRKALREPIKDRFGNIIILITANAAIVKEVFDSVGGFDNSFRKVGGEDLDLTYRLSQAGYQNRLQYAPLAVVEHKHRSNLTSFLRQQFGYGFWDMFHCLYRKRDPRDLGFEFPTPVNIIKFVFKSLRFSFSLIPTAPWKYGILKKCLLFPALEFVRRLAVMLGGAECYYTYEKKGFRSEAISSSSAT